MGTKAFPSTYTQIASLRGIKKAQTVWFALYYINVRLIIFYLLLLQFQLDAVHESSQQKLPVDGQTS